MGGKGSGRIKGSGRKERFVVYLDRDVADYMRRLAASLQVNTSKATESIIVQFVNQMKGGRT